MSVITPFNFFKNHTAGGGGAVTVGNHNCISATPAASTYTYTTHNQNTGSDGYLLVSVMSTSTFGVTVSGITWNGVSMTQLTQGVITNASGNLAIFGIATPATGTNDCVVTFSGTQSYPIALELQSFTGVGSITKPSGILQAQATPAIEDINTNTDCVVWGSSYSNFTHSNIEIPQGTVLSFNCDNVSMYGGLYSTAISGTLSSGGVQGEANTTAGNVALNWITLNPA